MEGVLKVNTPENGLSVEVGGNYVLASRKLGLVRGDDSSSCPNEGFHGVLPQQRPVS